MTDRRRRRAFAAGLVAGLLALTIDAPAARGHDDPDNGPVRIVAAATSDMVEVFAGDLTASVEATTEAVAQTWSAAYDRARANPTELSMPYYSGGTVIATYTTAAGADLTRRAARGLGPTKSVKVARSLAELDRIKSDVTYLTGAPFDGITTVFTQAERNRVIVEVPSAGEALRTALASRYGQAVAIHLSHLPPASTSDDGRANDNANFEGGSDYNAALNCTTGFAFTAATEEYMITAGHCTTNPGSAYTPNGTHMGDIAVDNWRNGQGSVMTSGSTDYHGDVSAIKIASGGNAQGQVHVGPPLPANSTLALPVRDRLHRWLVEGDQFCTSGARSGELCGWHVTSTNSNYQYKDGTWLRNGFRAAKNGNCTRPGDSGGPLYARNATEIVLAVGIISGRTDNNTSTPGSPCVLFATEILHVYYQVPGDIITM